MATYRNRKGEDVTEDDENRLVWYSLPGCGFWTDDWSQLSAVNGIPCCPHCHCPGMMTEAKKWNQGIADLEEKYPGYADFTERFKHHCFVKIGGWEAMMKKEGLK